MLKIEHLTKSYGEKKAVDDLLIYRYILKKEEFMDLSVIMVQERQQH